MRPAVLALLLCCAVALGACDRGPDRVLAIVTPPDASSTRLGWLARDTLVPDGRALELGEFHDAWAFAPDGRTLAVGTLGRTGVRLVDVAGLRIARDLPLPVAAEGVVWLGPDRIAVLLQRGGIVVLDPRGRVRGRRRLSSRAPCQGRRQAATAHGAVFVVTGRDASVRLVRVAAGRPGPDVVELPGVRAPAGPRTCGAPAFAVDPNGARAVVVGSRGPIAEVDLRSLAVRRHPAAALRARVRCARCPRRWTAEWPVPGTLAVAGDGAGASLVDTRTWAARRVDVAAGAVAAAPGGPVLTFAGERRGVAATGRDGRRRWHALAGVGVRDVVVAGPRAYVLDERARATRVLDLATGAVLATAAPLGDLSVLSARPAAAASS